MAQQSKKDSNPRSVHRYHFPPLSSGTSPQEEPHYDSPQQLTAKYQALMEEGREAGFAEGVRKGLEQGQQLGQERGFQTGVLEGREAGIQQALAECKPRQDEALQQIAQLHHALESALKETQAWQRESLCRLVSQVCRQVLRAELALKPTQILPLIEETLALLPKPQESVSIHLDPGTHALLKEFAAESLEGWSLQSDPQLSPGSFHIQTGLAEAESQLDTRIDQCVEQVRRQLAQAPELNDQEQELPAAAPQNLPWGEEDLVSTLSLPADKFSDDDFRA
ncbi:FliH/SctL family protein [Pluralibacter sp.]|uniref:FliH/SctL family protein n=1 Tax=Pluralibacter sp. TaxID=1920032 RepID=UPI0025E9355D|nr:FliH/SctL family protein [Pluralibacter sp.]MBV8043278.1 hypothetical protein [Pluralibacter sp.]